MARKYKTPKYFRDYQRNYQKRRSEEMVDKVCVEFPHGTKDRMKTLDIDNISEFIRNAVEVALNERAQEKYMQELEESFK